MLAQAFAITVTAGPDNPAHASALRFARAVLSRGHRIHQVFFYQEATRILAARGSAANPAQEWETLARRPDGKQGFSLCVCVAAAERRGLTQACAPWHLVGLGDWVEALDADQHLQFGADHHG